MVVVVVVVSGGYGARALSITSSPRASQTAEPNNFARRPGSEQLGEIKEPGAAAATSKDTAGRRPQEMSHVEQKSPAFHDTQI